MPGPHSTTEAPTDHISSTVPSTSKRGGGPLKGTPAPKVANTGNKGTVAAVPPNTSVTTGEGMSSLPGTAKEQGDIGGDVDTTVIYHIERPFSQFSGRENVYRKSHKFMTFGLAPNVLLYDSGTAPNVVMNAWLTTYLAEVPWHLPALYLNPSEFLLLNDGARATKLEIEVYYRGTTIQFQTATTATNLATLNQINDIAVAHGLNRSGQGSNVSYTGFDETYTMIPNGVTRPKYGPVGSSYRGMIVDYYGTDNTNPNFVDYVPHHQIGRQTFLYNYWALSSIDSQSTNVPVQTQHGGWPELADKIHQLDGKTAVNQCVLKSVYKPKVGSLKPPLRMVGHGLPIISVSDGNVPVAVGGSLPLNRISQFAPSASTSSAGIEASLAESMIAMNNGPVQNISYDLLTPIEKSQALRSGAWGEQVPHIQPSIHIGIQPVPALTTTQTLTSSTGDGSWTDTRGYWEVIATMHTKEVYPTEYPYASVANVPFGEVMYHSSTTGERPAIISDPRNDGATMGALYTNLSIQTRLGPDIAE